MKIIDRPDLQGVDERALWFLPLAAELFDDPHPVYLEIAAERIKRRIEKIKEQRAEKSYGVHKW